jgi:hypothetical protein
VPRAAITTVANLFYEEPYRTLPTHHLIDERGDTLHVAYGWRHPGRWNTLAVEASRVPEPIAPGSVEEFITEHYWGYTKRSNGSTSQYEVKHPSWAMYPVRRTLLEVDFAALYGQKFAMLDGCAPDHVLLAEGSAVSVDTGSTLPR